MDELFLLPGPVHTPPEVLRAAGRHPISHRGAEFSELYRRIQSKLQIAFGTSHPVTVFPSSGTGALEATVVNLFSPGDAVIACVMGQFGEKFANIADTFGLNVIRHEVPWGEAVEASAIQRLLAENPNVRGVLATHNETSTGVTLDLAAIGRVVRDHGALFCVDSVSGVPGVPMHMDAWGIDAVATGSQKAFLVQPGLSILALSQRGWQAAQESTMPRFYWDLRRYQADADQGMTPWTPATTLWFALDAALNLIMAEGLAAYQARCVRMSRMVRAGGAAVGMPALADEAHASPTVTALQVPAGIDAGKLMAALQKRHVQVAGGLGKLAGKVIRIGHMGGTQPEDLLGFLAQLTEALLELGAKVERQAAVKAALEVLR